jgi:hypothetical protein
VNELTEQERDIVDAMVDAELRGDLPEGGAVRAAEMMISQLRDLQEKRTSLLSRFYVKGKGGE